MYESGQSAAPSRRELLAALERVEAAHARHERGLRDAIRAAEEVPSQVRRNVQMLLDEANRLRRMLSE
jgi:Mg/Co/Ni transporter MgtE